jgi:hypothetical protein
MLAHGQVKAFEPSVGDGDPEIDLAGLDRHPAQHGHGRKNEGHSLHDDHLVSLYTLVGPKGRRFEERPGKPL